MINLKRDTKGQLKKASGLRTRELVVSIPQDNQILLKSVAQNFLTF